MGSNSQLQSQEIELSDIKIDSGTSFSPKKVVDIIRMKNNSKVSKELGILFKGKVELERKQSLME